MKKSVLICEFSQESNSFSPIIWDIDRFKDMALCGGTAMKLLYRFFKSPVSGMAKAVKEGGGKAVYGFAMRAMSGGPVADEAVELFLSKTREAIKKKGPFSALLLSLHGATVSKAHEDVCGYITQQLRKELGDDTVIGLSCDLHANVTELMEKSADYICGFQTYPHIDIYETGYRAGRLVMDRLNGKKPAQVYVRFPMIVPASGYTTAQGRFREIMEQGFDYVKQGQAEDFTIFMMQPWLDISCAGSCVTIVSHTPEPAREQAERLARLVYDSRSQFWPEKADREQVRQAALSHTAGKPVIWAEPADSPNAGAVGDSVELLKTILDWNEDLRAATTVMDPAAVEQAEKLGVGGSGRFTLGAGYTPGMFGPLELDCTVKSLSKGIFPMAGPMAKGVRLNIGPAAVLSCGKVDILVCNRPGGTGDVNYYKSFGMDWHNYDLMVVKANTSFRECYKDIADRIFVADTYGAASAELTSLPFKHIDRERFYPFNEMKS